MGPSLRAQLNGPYVVGPGGTFANITAAIAALETSGIAGPVSFMVTANDTGPWTLNPVRGQGAANPILFDGRGTVTISGAQPVLRLHGCDSVTFRGFNGTFSSTGDVVYISSQQTANCVFAGCDFRAPVASFGGAIFNFLAGSGCRIEDSTFGGSYEALVAGIANDATTVQRCRIIGGGSWVMRLLGSNFTLLNNFITGASGYGIACGLGNPASCVNLKFRHNSVFINHPAAGNQYCSLRWHSGAANTEVVNNVFCDFYPTLLPTGTFNVWCELGLRPAVMDHNCFWSNQANYFPVFASGSLSLTSWQALGFDLNSIQADPLYTAPLAATPDLSLQAASPCALAGVTLPAVLSDYFLSLRTAPVSIGAHEAVGGPGAAYAVFGAGCAGSIGVPTNSMWPVPSLGTTSVISFGGLLHPYGVVLMMGTSSTTWAMGPLPFHLGSRGAPGCSIRVSADTSVLLAGVGGSAGFTVAVPNLQQLLGLQVYTQGLALDFGRNALGAVTTDAAVARVGL